MLALSLALLYFFATIPLQEVVSINNNQGSGTDPMMEFPN